jgi:hypothetical protein
MDRGQPINLQTTRKIMPDAMGFKPAPTAQAFRLGRLPLPNHFLNIQRVWEGQ